MSALRGERSDPAGHLVNPIFSDFGMQPNAKIVKDYKPVMPTYKGQIDETEITQLLAYIESLKRPQ